MKKLSEFLLKHSNGKAVCISLAVALLYKTFAPDKVIAHFEQLSSGNKPLDFFAFLKGGEAYPLISSYGTEAVSYYLKAVLPVDIILPLVMGIAYALIIAFLLKKAATAPKYNFLCVLPFFTVTLFDYIENAGITVMLRAYPSSLNITAQITGIFTALKFAAYITEFLLMAFLFVLYLKNRFKSKKQTADNK